MSKRVNKKQQSFEELIQEQKKLAEELLKRSQKQLEEARKRIEAMKNRSCGTNDSPGGDKNVTFDHLRTFGFRVNTYDNPSMFLKLPKDRIKKIPTRSIEWFNAQSPLDVLAYSTDGKKMVSVQAFFNTRGETLYMLQQQGYRFIKHSTESYLEVAKDCNNCRHANKCPSVMKMTTLCPASKKIENGNVVLGVMKKEWDKLTHIEFEN